jgi:hypothetical protein
MAEKVSLKIVIFLSLFCGILSACMSPIDIEVFFAAPEVQALIDATTVAVRVDDKTGDGLVGRDRRIEGLKNYKYYMVETEINAEDNLSVSGYPKFVTDNHPTSPNIPGALCSELKWITRIKDGRINGLFNYNTYTVNDAKPLTPANGKLSYTDGIGTDPKSVNVTNGKITINNLIGTGNKGYLDLSSVITGDYQVMAVYPQTYDLSDTPKKSPWDWENKSSIDWSSFELEGEETEIDYVFYKKDNSVLHFYFLSVKIVGPNVEPVDLILNITFNIIDGTPTLTPSSFIFQQSKYNNNPLQSVEINISNSNGYDVKEWKYDGKSSNSFGTSSTITINNNSSYIDYLAEGKHTITLIAIKDEKPYSADFTLEVTK